MHAADKNADTCEEREKKESVRERSIARKIEGEGQEKTFKQVNREWEASKDKEKERWISSVVYPWLPACC